MRSYALYFVPPKMPREKLALLRRQLCRRFGSHKAVMFPIHMTLTRGVEIRDVKRFLLDVQNICSQQRPMRLSAEKTLVSGPYAAGVHIENTPSLSVFQQMLQECVDHYSSGALSRVFDPHISLVYGSRITGVHTIQNPVKHFLFDRLSVAVQDEEGQPYRVIEEFVLGEKLKKKE